MTLLTKHADTTTTWGPDVRALLGGYNATRTLYADEPHPGVSAIVANGSTNDATALQAQLDYVKTTWDTGRVVIPPDKTVKLNAGITIPAKVQLVYAGAVLDFSAISTTTGVAVTVDDSDFTPLIGTGGLIVGPSGDARNTPGTTTDVSIGVDVTGVRLDFIDVNVKSCGRGIRVSNSGTWSITFRGGSVYHCYYNIWSDHTADSATNAGESIVFDGMTIYNAVRGMRVTGNNVSMFFKSCRIDYLLTRFGEIEDARVEFHGCHLELSETAQAYLFDVDRNAHVDFLGCYVLMGADTPTNTTHYLFNPAKAPWNMGFGGARFHGTKIFYVNPSAANSEQRSEYLVTLPSGATTVAFHTPYPIRWCPVTAEFASVDSTTVSNFDQARVSWADASTGNITVTASASAGFNRQVLVRFGG